MRIFQSEQVLNLKKCPGFIGEKRMATEFARSQTTGLSCVGPMLGRYQKHTPKR